MKSLLSIKLLSLFQLSLLSAEFVSMAMYLGCMLAQLFIYCYFGTQLKYEVRVNRISAFKQAYNVTYRTPIVTI